jgi:hypothetical protein
LDSTESHVRRDPDVASVFELAGSGSEPRYSAGQPIPPADDDTPGSGFGLLRTVLEQACAEERCSRNALTVLAKDNDPFRLDTPANHRDAQWAAEQIERAFGPYKSVHPRGLHYAIVAAARVIKPNDQTYVNSVADDAWLALAVKAARWLGYVPFERISDNRSSDPVIYRSTIPFERPSASIETYAIAGRIEPPTVYFTSPEASLKNFSRPQPYAIAIFGEKSSLEDVLLPIARRFSADLYLGAGEASDTILYRMAKDGAADGRPLVVLTATDFDPSGRQMPVSIGRKLQAFKSLLFPSLEFEVVPTALNLEQVRDLDLPSTPLKDTERRADRWREAFGHEQTEIDALATLQPRVLQEIVERAIAPYFDDTVDWRIAQASSAWRHQAQRAINKRSNPQELAELQEATEAIEAELKEKIEAITSDADDRIDVINERLQAMVSGVRLPEFVVPEVAVAERDWQAILVSSEWSWADQTRALKARKSYGGGEGEI